MHHLSPQRLQFQKLANKSEVWAETKKIPWTLPFLWITSKKVANGKNQVAVCSLVQGFSSQTQHQKLCKFWFPMSVYDTGLTVSSHHLTLDRVSQSSKEENVQRWSTSVVYSEFCFVLSQMLLSFPAYLYLISSSTITQLPCLAYLPCLEATHLPHTAISGFGGARPRWRLVAEEGT